MKTSTLIKLCNKHGLDYIKRLSSHVIKVYDAQLDHYAVVEWRYSSKDGYTFISYRPTSL